MIHVKNITLCDNDDYVHDLQVKQPVTVKTHSSAMQVVSVSPPVMSRYTHAQEEHTCLISHFKFEMTTLKSEENPNFYSQRSGVSFHLVVSGHNTKAAAEAIMPTHTPCFKAITQTNKNRSLLMVLDVFFSFTPSLRSLCDTCF